MSQNQAKSNYKDCSFGNRDSFVKDTRLSVLILAKSQAGRKFEDIYKYIYIYIYRGYYTVARRYEFYVRVANTISHE